MLVDVIGLGATTLAGKSGEECELRRSKPQQLDLRGRRSDTFGIIVGRQCKGDGKGRRRDRGAHETIHERTTR